MMRNNLTTKMLRTAMVLACSAGLGAGAAIAQQDAPPPPPNSQQQGPPPNGPMKMNPERRVERLQRQLNLSDSQTAQLKAIVAESQAKMEALRADSSLAPKDRHAQMEEMRKGMQAKLRGILTPEQQTKFDEMQAKAREKQSERRAAAMGGDGTTPPPPPPPPSPSPAPQR